MNIKECINQMELRTGEDGTIKLAIKIPKGGLKFKNKKETQLYIEVLELLGSEMDYLNISGISKLNIGKKTKRLD